MTIRLHVIFPFHTKATSEFSHCAFTIAKAQTFSRMMAKVPGYEVISYANEGSEVGGELVTMLSTSEYAACFPPLEPGKMHGDQATMGSTGWCAFDMKLRDELKARVKPYDFVCHPFGRAHGQLTALMPQALHVETGIGYPDAPFGAFRVFESETWRHYHFGRWENASGPDGKNPYANNPGLFRNLSWVIDNCRDVEEWPRGSGAGDYVLFMGRIDECKGMSTISKIIRKWDELYPNDGMRFVMAGQGNIDKFMWDTCAGGRVHLLNRIDYRGNVKGAARAKLVGDARCMICPTNYVEPGGGAAIEALLCGTPVIASDWGCFVETVEHGVNGYRCKTIADWMKGIVSLQGLDSNRRAAICDAARNRFSIDAAAPKYDRVFRQLLSMAINGPDSLESINVP